YKCYSSYICFPVNLCDFSVTWIKKEPENMEEASAICYQCFSLLIWIGVGIAMIVMGTIHKDNCEIQPYIPVFLLVTGAIHLITFFTVLMRLVCETFSSIVEGIIGSFSFGWFITGSVWVFSVYNSYEGHCDKNLYLFAFVILILEYSFMALFLCCCCWFSSLKTIFYERLQ
ncbi:hypothetical protein XENTR_v10011274, partial [Xenopus tropicalis]